MNRCLIRSLTRAARCQRLAPAPAMSSVVARGGGPLAASSLGISTPRHFCSQSADPVHQKIDGFVKDAKVVVFMKGEKGAPQCGFSNAVVQILRMHDVSFESHNVLADEDIRQGIKEYSNWPTIPQVFFEGEFVGGCDILLQMHQ